MGVALYPLYFNETNNMLDKDGIIHNDEIFKAVCNGYEIEFTDDNGGDNSSGGGNGGSKGFIDI